MKLKITLFIAAFTSALFFSTSYAQQSSESDGIKTLSGIEVGVKSGFFYEQRLSRSLSVRGSVGYTIGTGLTFHDGFSFSGIRPLINVAPRWYYTVSSRTRKGESILNNAAPYFALNLSYSTEKGAFGLPKKASNQEKWSAFIVPAWGIQHNISDDLQLNAEIGISIGYTRLTHKEGVFSKNWKTKNDIVGTLGLSYIF